jgi:hypothetical protein
MFTIRKWHIEYVAADGMPVQEQPILASTSREACGLLLKMVPAARIVSVHISLGMTMEHGQFVSH